MRTGHSPSRRPDRIDTPPAAGAGTATPAAAFAVDDSLCTVLSNRAVNARYRHLVLEAPAPLCNAGAGQFAHLLCPVSGADSPFLRRPMSVYRADPARQRVEFLYNVVGSGTRALATLQLGDALRALGPLGRGFTVPAGARHVMVVARGVGFATLAPLVPLAARRGLRVSALLSARSPGDLMRDEFEQGAAPRILAVFDSDGSSAMPRVEALLREQFASDRPDAVYTCGSNRLLVLLQRLCAQAAIAGEVALEQQMACALGVCLCCVRSLRARDGSIEHGRVCCEGPVFGLQAVVPAAAGGHAR